MAWRKFRVELFALYKHLKGDVVRWGLVSSNIPAVRELEEMTLS